MFLLNGKKVSVDSPITVDDVTYGNLRDPYIRLALGVIEVPDPEWPQPSDEYFVTENEDGSLTITKKPDDIIAKQNQSKLNQVSLKYLQDTDWYVNRFAETGTPIPEDIKTKRQEARDAIIHEQT